MPARELEDLPFAPFLEPWDGTLHADVRYDTVQFDGAELEAPIATGARFIESALMSSTFDGGSFRLSRWSDVWMKAVRWIGTDLSGTDWMDVEIIGSVFAGTAIYDAQMRRVVLHESKADSVNLRGARLQEVSFVDCQLSHIDFAGATLVDVTFAGCELHGAAFDNAHLKNVDFRHAHELSITSGYESLKGATISTSQLVHLAPALAQVLGISVVDG
ncbi:MAG TPA: pentapeptide repeat-containing protein [Frankiaceae bacterium]|nr:pentapeptide repeat-containing protein [Frankiaceae bacterium]